MNDEIKKTIISKMAVFSLGKPFSGGCLNPTKRRMAAQRG